MIVFVLSLLVMLLIVAGMAIGAMAGRGPLKGSCGGLAAVGIEGKCEICGDDPSRCDKKSDAGVTGISDTASKSSILASTSSTSASTSSISSSTPSPDDYDASKPDSAR